MSPWTDRKARTPARTLLLLVGLQASLRVHGEYNNSSSPAPAKPEIEQIWDVTVKAGHVAVLTCRVSGYPEPSIQWSRRDVQGPVIYSGNYTRFSADGNGTLTIYNVTLTDAGTYYCAGENEHGFDQTSADLIVTAKPTFTVRPMNVTVEIGRSVALKCEVTGFPNPTVFWSRGTGKHLVFPSQDHGRFTVTRNGTLHIDSVETEDSGVYLCQAINLQGSAEVAAKITVHEPPIIISGPENRNVTEGESVELTCESSGSPRPVVTWLRNGQVIRPSDPRTSISSNGTLKIAEARSADNGKYTCRVINVLGEATRSAQITVYELTIPPTVLTPAETRTLTVGDDLELSCQSAGNPSPYRRWFRNGKIVDFTDPRNTLYGGKLIIKSTVLTDSGNYTCQAFNSVGKNSQTFVIIVQEAPVPPTILTQPQHQTLTVGDRLELWCRVSGTPPPAVTWFRDGTPLRSEDSHQRFTEERPFYISSVEESDAGIYTCKATNEAGESIQSSLIKIKALHISPKILNGPRNVNLTLGARLVLSCKADGTPDPIISWLRHDRPIVLTDPRVNVTTEGSLVVNGVRVSDSGVYTCKASNIAGETSLSANISIAEGRCSCISVPKNGEVTIYGSKPGDIARFVCDPGFSLIGREYISCDTNGQWTDSPAVCREGIPTGGVPFATCAISATDQHTLFYLAYQLLPTNATSRFPHGTELQARCSHIGKYTFHGSHSLVCKHGHWTDPVPYCSTNGLTSGNFTPEVDFRVERGQYLVTPDGRLAVRPRSKVILICRYNNTADWFLYWVNEHRNSYPTVETDDTTLQLTIENIEQSDSGEFSCLNVDKVGKTTIRISVEDWTCPPSVLTSQNIILAEEDNKLGGRAVFRCAEGYTMEGSDTSTCMVGGNWHPSPPLCKGLVCPCFELTSNLVSRVQRNDRAYNAYFSCVPGFELRGKADITCNPNGTWSDPVPSCVEVDCGTPPGLSEGRLVGNVTTVGGVFYFWCDTGTIPDGAPHFTRCQSDGTWSSFSPTCLDVRCDVSENDCFVLNCSESKQYLVPRDQQSRHWGCCGDSLYDMRSSVCDQDVTSAVPCSQGHPCANGNCVPNNQVCDGVNQCSDGSDERGCPPCETTQFRCRGGQCIDINNVCNREKNCHDGSDEAGCARGLAPIGVGEVAWCGRNEFTCPGDRVCIPLSKICDGRYDCDGGYDEEQCGAVHCNPRVEICRTVSCPDGDLAFIPVRTRYVEWGCCRRVLYNRKKTFCSTHGVYPCPAVSFRCWNGNCVPPRWQCDSENDCSDGSDEAGCHGCPTEEYNCGDRQCVHVSEMCDKVKHCYNGMDEVHCARSDGQWCGTKQYRCANDNCIPREKVCNHIDDCGDKSDEVKCFPHE